MLGYDVRGGDSCGSGIDTAVELLLSSAPPRIGGNGRGKGN